ncbi:uncharacterized protein PFB0145c [Aphidius gifuensis]|uniref:uncharacterized protein PFB0145c n=1 Tax=Aphidius gifuensis TaxID=684658 RepID=UPI001CDB5951|nr:uncharacterized protein PFB0145c [Aphidius gifuensis]
MAISDNQQQQQLQENIDNCYLLKWPDHNDYMLSVASQLFKENSMVDVTLVVDGEHIYAHRIVLCSYSTLFQDLLNDAKDDNPTIIICGISAHDVRLIIDWCYSGKFPDDLKSFQEAAFLFQIDVIIKLDEINDDDNDDVVGADTTTLITKDICDDSQEALGEFISSDNEEILDETFNIQNEINDNNDNNDDTDNYNDEINDNEQEEPQNNIINEIQLNNDTINKKKKRRKEHLKREYSKEMLESALKDIKNGMSLIEAASKNGIPRSTLYMRAKTMQIPLHAPRNEYSAETMDGAISAVLKGSSLQNASEIFRIPKTVLWRRIQKDGYRIIRTDKKKIYASEKRKAAIEALKRGENLTKVSIEYKVPKTTLFRDKARLIDEGKLPSSFWKKRKTANEAYKKAQLEEAVAACKNDKLSQAAASIKYGIPKTTIWRRLQHFNNNKKKNKQQNIINSENNTNNKQIENEIIDINAIDDENDYSICGTSDISIAYIDNDTEIPQNGIILEGVEHIDEVHDEEYTSIISLDDDS